MAGTRRNPPVPSRRSGPLSARGRYIVRSRTSTARRGVQDRARARYSGVMEMTNPDWSAAYAEIDERGWALLPRLLDAPACLEAAGLWSAESRFRSRVTMSRHGFGRGEYRYFDYPLPEPVARLRTALYPPLAWVANRWQEALGRADRYPEVHDDYLTRSAAAGQARPTPLLLRYEAGDYNCLHQDLYGVEAFPLQVAILLSRPGEDFTGGEFLLAEQRPRRQSRATVVPLEQGDAVAFAVSERPVQGSRGVYRARMKHGVSTIRSGERFTLGVIFHDAA